MQWKRLTAVVAQDRSVSTSGLHQGAGKIVWPQSNKKLLGAPSIATRSKDATIGAPGLATSNKKLLGAPAIATRSKDATEAS